MCGSLSPLPPSSASSSSLSPCGLRWFDGVLRVDGASAPRLSPIPLPTCHMLKAWCLESTTNKTVASVLPSGAAVGTDAKTTAALPAGQWLPSTSNYTKQCDAIGLPQILVLRIMAVLNPRSAASLNKDWTLNLCKKKGDDAFTGLGLCKFRPVTWQAEGATYQSSVCISVWFTTPYSDTLQQSPGLCISKESYNVTCCKWQCVSDTQYFPSDWLKSTTFNGWMNFQEGNYRSCWRTESREFWQPLPRKMFEIWEEYLCPLKDVSSISSRC